MATKNSTFKKFNGGLRDIEAGDIQTLTLANQNIPGFGSNCDIHYQKVGNYYSNIWIDNHLGVYFFPADDTATINDIVTNYFGLTLVQKYGGINYGAYVGTYNTPNWSANPPSNSPRNILLGFFAV